MDTTINPIILGTPVINPKLYNQISIQCRSHLSIVESIIVVGIIYQPIQKFRPYKMQIRWALQIVEVPLVQFQPISSLSNTNWSQIHVVEMEQLWDYFLKLTMSW